MEFVRDNLAVVLVLAALALVLLFLLLRPRQRVRLSNDNVPQRPHMAHSAKPKREGRGVTDEAAAAASDVAGEIFGARVHDHLPGASGPPDDLTVLKGVGPKFAELLKARGIVRFDQLSRLTPEEIERLDPALGPFRGRLIRDRIIEQADYLSRGDTEGYEHRFGKL